jgi:hypothetical protein
MRQLAAVLLFVLCATSIATAQSKPDHLAEFLQDYLGKPYPLFEQEWATRYSSALVDLKDDGTKEVIVYVTGRAWCGTGGCTMLILTPEGEFYRVITKTTVTRLPIRVLNTKSNGWHDISVVARTSGTESLSEVILPFDGETYPISLSMTSTRRPNGKVQGEIVMPVTAKGRLLYQ